MRSREKAAFLWVAAICFVLATFPAVAEGGGVELDIYGTGRLAAGDMAEFSRGTLGGGAAVEWVLPFLPVLGVSGRAECHASLGLAEGIDSWWGATLAGGAFVRVPIGSALELRPELCYGVMMHMVEATERGVDGLFTDQIVQVAVGLRFSPAAFRAIGLGVEVKKSILVQSQKTLIFLSN